jgi:prophage antirepressor-like protein
MNAVIPHSFEDQLVRSVMRDEEPWFIGNDVSKALGYRDAANAMRNLDDDEKGTQIVSTLGGDQMLTIVSEPGVFRLIFTSRKPEAERFKRWLAHDVLPKLRRSGSYSLDQPGLQQGFEAINPRDMDATARMRCVDLAARLHGLAYARQLYREVGLPRVIMPVIGGDEEARDCLEQVLSVEAFGVCALDILHRALDEAAGPNEPLRHVGIISLPEEDGFIIANRHPEIEKVMKGTRWNLAGWGHVLRRLNGATPTKAKRFAAGEVSRGTFLPATVLDLLE